MGRSLGATQGLRAFDDAVYSPGTSEPRQGRSFAWGRRTVWISWQDDQYALVVEALEGLHDEAPQSRAFRAGKAGIRALT